MVMIARARGLFPAKLRPTVVPDEGDRVFGGDEEGANVILQSNSMQKSAVATQELPEHLF